MKTIYLSLLLLLLITITKQCTEVTFAIQDKSIVSARTMDFPVPQGTKLEIIPVGIVFISTNPADSNLFTWNTLHGYVGFSAFGPNKTADGMNDCGLSCAALMMIESEYQNPYTTNKKKLGASKVCDYILSQFCNVQDAQTMLSTLCIYQDILIGNIPTPLLHVSIRDAYGDAIVLEFIKGYQVYHVNNIGVLTNDPTYDWHIKNIQNYNYANNITPSGTIKINNFVYDAFSSGYAVSNWGMSSDDGPVSRFVRAAMTIRFMYLPTDGDTGVIAGFHLLSKVEVVPGTTVLVNSKGTDLVDKTYYKIVRNHSEKRLYYSTFFDPTIRMIDLDSINFNLPIYSFEPRLIVDIHNDRFVNITSTLLA